MADRDLQAAIWASLKTEAVNYLRSSPQRGSSGERLQAATGGRGGLGPVGAAHLAKARERAQASRSQQQHPAQRAPITYKGTLAREGIIPASDRGPGHNSRRERSISPRVGTRGAGGSDVGRPGSPRGDGRAPLASLPQGMPDDLPAEAHGSISRRVERLGVRELAVPLGDGWMQRAGRGTFHVSGGEGGSDALRASNITGGSDSGSDAGGNTSAPKPAVMEVESSEPNFYLLTYDQTPDAHVTRSGYYRVEATMRAMPSITVRELPYAALCLNWQRGRSTLTAPCFLAVVMTSNAWRIEQYCEGQQSMLAEVRDSTIKPGGTFHRVAVEVKNDRLSLHVNKRAVVDTLLVPPPPSSTAAPARSSPLTGSAGLAVYKSRMQVKKFELIPLEPPEEGSAEAHAMAAASRPQFTGGDPKLIEMIEAEMMESSPNVAWESVGGCAEAKRLLNEAVVLPLLIPDYFAAAACRSSWKGVLLFGPPGTGKTLLAKAVASLGKTAFFNISASSLVSKYHGESEKLARTLFALARHHAPSVVFFDEIDALVSARGAAGEHEASRRLKSELLSQMDGVNSASGGASSGGGGNPQSDLVMVLATTNKPWDLDEALRRRLERRIYVPLPDEAARAEMLDIHLKGVRLDDEVDLFELAKRTEGYSGADLQLACRDASMMPMRRMVEGKSPAQIVELQASGQLEGKVNDEDFTTALSRTQPSTASHEHRLYEAWNDEYGCK